jgi:hypothetical protein
MSIYLLIRIAGLVALAAPQPVVLEQAHVTFDAGTKGNVGYGNLPDPGDELGCTIPPGVEAGVYWVSVDGRSGAQLGGRDFISSYRLVAPPTAFAAGVKPHEVPLELPPGVEPKEKSKGPGYYVFEAYMRASEKLYLRPGDEVKVHAGAGRGRLSAVLPGAATRDEGRGSNEPGRARASRGEGGGAGDGEGVLRGDRCVDGAGGGKEAGVRHSGG